MRIGNAFHRSWIVLLVVAGVASSGAARYGGGAGQFNDPYLIFTAGQLNAIGAEPDDWDKHFRLMADIDLSGLDGLNGRPAFNQIAPDTDTAEGFRGKPFTGVFDGNNHTVSHLVLTGGHYVGLFGQLEATGVVMDLRLIDVAVTGTGDYVGAIAGWNFGCVTRCSSKGTVRGNAAVGGLVGYNWAAVSQCSATGHAEGRLGVGGLAGSNSGVVVQCCSTTSVEGVEAVGGLVGSSTFGQMTQCYSTGPVSGTVAVGGLAGDSGTTVTACFWDIETSGQSMSAAGTGLTTDQMREAATYLTAGWDWAGETDNGTADIWQESLAEGYPVLTAFDGYVSPRLQGHGEPDAPYLIHDAQELGAIARGNPRACYRLNASIDLSGIRWTTAVIPWFGGTFDGQGWTVSNLTIVGGGNLGLFGQLAFGAQVTDLGIIDANIVGSGDQIGSLAGWNYGPVTCCCSSGNISGNRRVGGLIGYNWGVVTQCYNAGAVLGASDVGGLVGYNEYGDVTCCYSSGPVAGAWDVGGLVGRPGPLAVLAHCFWDIDASGQAVDAGSTGLPTPQMQTARTFLAARWDFMGESRNGTRDFWWLIEGRTYPRLWWEPPEQP